MSVGKEYWWRDRLGHYGERGKRYRVKVLIRARGPGPRNCMVKPVEGECDPVVVPCRSLRTK